MCFACLSNEMPCLLCERQKELDALCSLDLSDNDNDNDNDIGNSNSHSHNEADDTFGIQPTEIVPDTPDNDYQSSRQAAPWQHQQQHNQQHKSMPSRCISPIVTGGKVVYSPQAPLIVKRAAPPPPPTPPPPPPPAKPQAQANTFSSKYTTNSSNSSSSNNNNKKCIEDSVHYEDDIDDDLFDTEAHKNVFKVNNGFKAPSLVVANKFANGAKPPSWNNNSSNNNNNNKGFANDASSFVMLGSDDDDDDDCGKAAQANSSRASLLSKTPGYENDDDDDDDDDDDIDEIDLAAFESAHKAARSAAANSNNNKLLLAAAAASSVTATATSSNIYNISIPDINAYEKIQWLFNDIKDCSPYYRSLDYPHSDTMLSAFRNLFGLKLFRPQQFEAINAALLSHNCFVLMPTGGGKSLCYQLPAVASKGVTFVVSPLKSLIIDQVQKLNALGLNAAHLLSEGNGNGGGGGGGDEDHGGNVNSEQVYHDLCLKEPRLKIIYVTPEKLNGSAKLTNILNGLYARNMMSRLVIDEAHCVSTWGHDFRKDYTQMGTLRQRLFPNVPVMLLVSIIVIRMI